MALESFHCKKPYEILSEQEILSIHHGSLEVLAETGMTVADERSRKILQDGGCVVDHDTKRVRFPSDLVQWAIDKCPDSFQVKARTPELTLDLGGDRVYFASFPGFTWLDIDTEERIEATVDDCAKLVRLCDALPMVHTLCQPVAHLGDKPPEVELEWVHATELRNTDKTIMGTAFGGSSKWLVKMVEATDQQTLGGICIASPLVIPEDQAQGILHYAESGNPQLILSGPSKGATGPATMAGTLVLQNAEILGGTVLAQLAKPGCGVMYMGYTTPMDMRFGTMASGAAEVGIMAVGTAQLARFYKMPSGVFYPMTDAKTPDPQAIYEKHLQTYLCATAGVNYIMPLGGLDNEGTHSPTQMVIDNEVCRMVGKVLEGIKVDQEHLAVDLIKEVGPVPGNYLKTEHTRQYWREEYIIPEVGVREEYNTWVMNGRKGVLDQAKERARHLMDTHQHNPLPIEAERELAKILIAAENEKIPS
ncbi:MAG: trimethylamine methyltransferase family protein [Chloroflexi bacterium]|nr:trimethylamine methyltransferase family protein [Chloroflexota bacterium]